MDATTLKSLVSSRGYIRKDVTIKRKYVESNINNMSDSDKALYAELLKDLKIKLDTANGPIMQGLSILEAEQSKLDDEASKSGTYNMELITTIHQLEFKTVTPTYNYPKGLKLPEIALPTYSHSNGESLEKFFQGFEGVIVKHVNLSEFEKFRLLENSLSGDPKNLIKPLKGTRQSYDEAKKLLERAFADPLSQKYESVERLSKLKLACDGNPYSFISEVSEIVDSFDSLRIDSNLVVQYFVWKALNEAFQAQLVNITGKNKPSLAEIQDRFFEANERFQIVQKKPKEKKILLKDEPDMTLSMASNITAKAKSIICSLCKEDKKEFNHPLFKCPIYTTIDQRLKKLKEIGGCSKCGHSSHDMKSCRFKFQRKCDKCNSWHFSFLCDLSLKSTVKSTPANSNKQTSSSMIVSYSLLNFCEYSALTTFSCNLFSKQRRCLKDSGGQLNFILSRVAEEENFKILNPNYELKINGINSSRAYVTKTVEVKIQLSNGIQVLSAVCLPKIDISMQLPGLSSAVSSFLKRGYQMADRFLLHGEDSISGIEFILGTVSSHILPEKEIVFGNKDFPSSYKETNEGVMLLGDMDNLLRNVLELPTVLNSVPDNNISDRSEEYWEFSKLPKSQSKEVAYTEPKSGTILSNFTNSNISVLDAKGNIVESVLQRATEDILNQHCSNVLNYERETCNECSIDRNDDLIDLSLSSIERNSEGRLIMGLLWNSRSSHLLGRNYNLARQILQSNLKKLKKTEGHLSLVNNVFKEQEGLGIITKVNNIEEFLTQNPTCSFLSHMPVFRPEKESTKTRVVFLSNMAERNKDTGLSVSHNQSMLAGSCLNRKISTALMQLRFDKFILGFDLVKAFLQIELRDQDKEKLLFLWFKNIERDDYSLIAYKNNRLPFGLVCSPNLLMVGLYYILIVDTEGDSKELAFLKRQIYDKAYMDNCSLSANNFETLEWAYFQLENIFLPYKFPVQQFVTNNIQLQHQIDKKIGTETPSKVKLLGLSWNRIEDTLSTRKLELNTKATSKREILSSIASNYDVFNFCGPMLNRARIFMHSLQMQKDFGWDDQLSPDQTRKWRNICKQLNAAPEITLKRFVGKTTDNYYLIAFSDSSKDIFGTVIYIYNIDTGDISFLMAKNRIINAKLENKTMPQLEFNAVVLGSETILGVYTELTGPTCVNPLKITKLFLFSDSLIALNWLKLHVFKFDKMRKKSIFVMNRLETVSKLCQKFPITFAFVPGEENPADCITRPLSYKQLSRSNFFAGLKMFNEFSLVDDDIFSVTVPNLNERESVEVINLVVTQESQEYNSYYSSISGRFENLFKLIRVQGYILQFVNQLKWRLKTRNKEKFQHLICKDLQCWKRESYRFLILQDQKQHFPDIVEFFNKKKTVVREIPHLVTQLNLVPDRYGLLRVRGKFVRWKETSFNSPVLLAKESILAKLIIFSYHSSFGHAGLYSTLTEMRKEFWIPHGFSVIKRVIRTCMICKKINARPCTINQSSYRDFRLEPSNIPYRNIFLDFFGPYLVNYDGKKVKVYVLCITCLWSRAINLKVCRDLTTEGYLRALSLHCLEYGVPELCLSDMGSQLVAGSKIVLDFFRDADTQKFFRDHEIKPIKFEHYVKGRNELGSLIESCVKLSKILIQKAIGKNVLEYFDFDYLICSTVHLINRRPIAFKDGLRDTFTKEEIPAPITPEILLKGYELVSLNILPNLHPIPEEDPTWNPNLGSISMVRENFMKLNKARNKLIELYNEEFLAKLISQATNVADRYKPVAIKNPKPGDIVLIKEPYSKQANFPMGIIKTVNINHLGEVTDVTVLKGKTKEVLRRHVVSIIPLLSVEDEEQTGQQVNPDSGAVIDSICSPILGRVQRKAALDCKRQLSKLSEQNLV